MNIPFSVDFVGPDALITMARLGAMPRMYCQNQEEVDFELLYTVPRKWQWKLPILLED
jgi:hypothetical protein